MLRMKYIFILLFILSGVGLHAQVDNPTGGIAIPKSKTTVTPNTPAKAEAPSPKAPSKKSFMSYDLPGKGLSTEKKNDFVSGATEYKERANSNVLPKGESNGEAYRGNLDFGLIKTKSPYIILNMRDFGAEDGDRVKVTINDKVIISVTVLQNENQAVMITLYEGFNNIHIEALNQGTSGPNTGEFNIYDNKDERLSGHEWNLYTGFYAKFLILKE